jgi:UDP-N-acetylglucosamine--N-acetylmuramyl-(pentapeptide) pyrophosphoryl-undecaprenol N-acetylglucosamine transferase
MGVDVQAGTVAVSAPLPEIATGAAVLATAADLAVARAGAMSIAELCAWGVPQLLVPLPTAAQDHQSHNARATAAVGAAIHVPQAQLTVDLLDTTVRTLQSEPARLGSMRTAAVSRARPGAADAIARHILQTVTHR